jgi:predicted nucleic acid-binding protein
VTTIYLDACCLNRPFDDQTQARIRLEAEAVLIILARFETGQWEWIGSKVLDLEIDRTPDPERRRRVRLLAFHAHRSVLVGQSEIERAQQLEAWGFSAFDALHLACAESGSSDVFLTTDDALLRKSATYAEQLRLRVENPLTWLREVSES